MVPPFDTREHQEWGRGDIGARRGRITVVVAEHSSREARDQWPTAGGARRWLPLVTGLFVTVLIISNIIAVKLVTIGPLVVTAAIVLFPVSYILADVLTEVYGYAVARRTIWIGFLCNLVAVLAIVAGGLIPAAPFWDGQDAYDAILGYSSRLLVASFVAYLGGEFLNAFVLAKLKLRTGGRHLWLRTIGSTLVGQALDSAVFVVVAFAGVLPTGAWSPRRVAVGRQVAVRSPGHAADLSRGRLPEAQRRRRSLRSSDAVQSSGVARRLTIARNRRHVAVPARTASGESDELVSPEPPPRGVALVLVEVAAGTPNPTDSAIAAGSG